MQIVLFIINNMDDLIQIDLNGQIPGVYYVLANGVTAQKILLK